jgi:hypothetical protein
MKRREPRLRYPLRDKPSETEWGPEIDMLAALLLGLWFNGMVHFFGW